jgi:hypothetical protein
VPIERLWVDWKGAGGKERLRVNSRRERERERDEELH